MTNVLAGWGLTRDSALWLWGKVAGVAIMIVTGVLDPKRLGLSDKQAHTVMVIAGAIAYLSGQFSSSGLPAKSDAQKVSDSTRIGVGVVLLALLLPASARAEGLATPDRRVTPGVTRQLTNTTICSTKWGKDARAVTEAMKKQVAAAYGLNRAHIVAYGKGPCCEFDHLISRELGGADDVKNLWPQRWTDAKKKDRLENKLHVLVCSGDLALEDAQHAIATDWVAAYRRYVGPLGQEK